MINTIIESIPIIGGLWSKFWEWRNKKSVYNYLKENTENNATNKFKKTVEIANHVNLPENEVEEICSVHSEIDQCQEEPGNWGIYGPEKKSVYEERGIITLE